MEGRKGGRDKGSYELYVTFKRSLKTNVNINNKTNKQNVSCKGTECILFPLIMDQNIHLQHLSCLFEVFSVQIHGCLEVTLLLPVCVVSVPVFCCISFAAVICGHLHFC